MQAPAPEQHLVDRTTAYARAVVSREIVAGPLVRKACARHLQDLETGADRGLRFDVAEAERAIAFFPEVLSIDIETTDEYGDVVSEYIPFELQGWQQFVVGSLFGWQNAGGRRYDAKQFYVRRFRRAYVEIGKGNGKSPLAAGIGYYMLIGMGKLRAEVYSAATDKDQAAILFRDATGMRVRSPGLQALLTTRGANPVWELHGNGAVDDRLEGSFFKPISSDKKGKSGIRPYCALIDEVHEHPDNSVIEMMRAGTKGNQEALIFEITNSGFDKKTVCGQEHDYSVQILNGEVVGDAWFAFIASLDADDDPFEDEACWLKANPNLGVSIRPQFIREQVEEARGMPSKEGYVRRLHFCQWTESEDAAIPQKLWAEAEGKFDPDELTRRNVPCYGGLDLSRARDLTAFTLTWVLDATKDQERFASMTFFWTPKDTIAERSKRDRSPYQVWVDLNHMEAVPGPRIRYSWIADALSVICAKYHPVIIGGDQYGLEHLLEQLNDKGHSLPVEVHPQGFQRRIIGEREDGDDVEESGAEKVALWMPDSINKLEAALLEKRLTVATNPVMRMCARSVVYETNRTGHRMFDKGKATQRIDGMVSLAMSIGMATTGIGRASFDMDEYLRTAAAHA